MSIKGYLLQLLQLFKQSLQELFRKYREIEKNIVEPFLEELWYLRVPAFTAVLSIIFFAFIDQTLEIYRIFALNPSFTWHIYLSFTSIFVLSLSICHSAVALANKRVAELNIRQQYKDKYKGSGKQGVNFADVISTTLNGIYSVLCLICKYLKSPKSYLREKEKDGDDLVKVSKIIAKVSKATALLFLPRILGFIPLLALGFGLFRTLWGVNFGLFQIDNIMTRFLGMLFAFLIIVFIIVFSSYCNTLFGVLIWFILGMLGSLGSFLRNTIISNGPQCVKTTFYPKAIFNQDIGCQLSPVLSLCFGILITVFLFIWYLKLDISRGEVIPDLDISRGEVIQDEGSNQPTSKTSSKRITSSLFNLNPSSDLLFIPFVIVLSISLSIIAISIFTFPLITNEVAKRFAIIFILLLLYLISKLVDLNNRKISLILFFSAIVLLLAALWLPLAPYIGSIVIIALFLIIFLTLSSMIFYVEYKTRIPFITIFLISALVFSFFNLNDNHRFRELSENSKSLLPLEMQFKTWIEPRKEEILAFKAKNKQYPIYLVSAQGGGIFAAYHAASTLSRLQDLCPAFAHHVFAISGVSGGSLGATAFSSLVNSVQPQYTQDCPGKVLPENLTKDLRGPLENYAHQLLDQDLLSPLLAAGLFPDFLQRFLFFPIETIDRARGLEYAFEQGWDKIEWDKKEHPNLLKHSYYDHWNPKSAAPALVLNTTVVETGERLLLSPFTFKTQDSPKNLKFPALVDISTVACPGNNKSHIDFPLSTAAVLSARFPFVTPVGWFNRCHDKNGDPIPKPNSKSRNGDPIPKPNSKSRLADGGYFENSGFSTAFNIGQGLEKILEGGLENEIDQHAVKSTTGYPPKIKVVYLALTDNSPLNQESGGLNELLSPMTALFNSREARGRSIIEQSEYKIDGNETKNLSKHRFRQFYLTHFAPKKNAQVNVCPLGSEAKDCLPTDGKSNFNLPLGWYLSKFSQDYIRDRIGNPIGCQHDNPNALNPNNINHCIMKSVIHELSEPVDPSNS